MEELLLGALLAADELYVVHEQHVCLAVFVVEFLGGLFTDGVNELVGELLPLDIDDTGVGAVLFDLIADGIEQVGLAQARSSIDEQGVVGLGGIGRHRQGGRMGKFVGGAHNKGVKGVVVLPTQGGALNLLLGEALEDVAAGGRFALLRVVALQLDVYPKAQYRLKGLVEQGEIFFLNDGLSEKGAHVEIGGGVLKFDWLDDGDPGPVGHVGDAALGAAELLN